ncbi:isochorismatase family protein [Candidatus Sumerlaeota bacterium]|nr:isochorismatase family protein [Candidatus Sumerlaeota bacterium]
MAFGKSHRIEKDDSVVMVVDIQERLLPAIHEHERMSAQSAKLIQGARVIGVPIIWTEQYKKGLGETAPAIKEAIGGAAEPLEKMTFGCLDYEGIKRAFDALHRHTLILCGIEAHVCVLQTALKGLDDGLRVVLAEDAVSSRKPADCGAGIARMYKEGVVPATVEMLLMEWMKVAGTDTFKKVLPIIK